MRLSRRSMIRTVGAIGAASLGGVAASGTAAADGIGNGDRVKTTANLYIHPEPDLYSRNKWLAPEGSAGYVRDGPVDGYYFTWWKVGFNAGHEGWCVEEYLTPAPLEDYPGNDSGDDDPSGRDPLPFDVETDLKQPVAVTAQDIDDAIAAVSPQSPLIGLGDTWIDMQEEYSINALYQAAHAIHESAWGTSNIAQDHNNIYGWDAKDACPYDCADGYVSFDQCVRKVMPKINDGYLTPGDYRYNGATLEGMNVKYASDKYEWDDPKTWAEKIAGVYRLLAQQM